MRITSVDVMRLRVELPSGVADAMAELTHWDVIATRVSTDHGMVGWGYNGTAGESSEAVASLLEKDMAPRFIGADPFLVRRLWQEIYLDRFHTGITGVAFQGVAAIEIALWDIIAKASNQPLWRILGGYRSERIPIYSTVGGWLSFSEAELVKNATKIKADGFHGFKMKVGKDDLAEDCRRLAAVRKAVGPHYPVMIDANGKWDVTTARRAIHALEPSNPYWFEEPVHPFDVSSHATLARSTRIPLVAGESICDLRMFRDFLVAGALGIAQPDVLKLGGISGWQEVAALARAFGLPVVPAAYNLMQIDVQLMAAAPQGLMMEHLPWISSLFEHPVRIEHGYALVPQEPGAGTTFSRDAISRYGVA